MLNSLLNEDTRALWQKIVGSAERILLCSHVGPDGDAVGSCLGLADYLRNMGKQVQIALPNAFPDFLRWLPGSTDIRMFEQSPDAVEKWVHDADAVICLDFNNLKRIAGLGELIEAADVPKIMIDHHLYPDSFAALVFSDPSMCSTCELVFRLIWDLGGYEALSIDGAAALYCGMMTDTGAFTYNSSRSEIYFIISQLLAKGIDKDKIYRNVYYNYSRGRVRLMGYVLYEKLRFFPGCRASLFTLTDAEMKQFGYIRGDSEGFVNLPLMVRGQLLSVFLREDAEKKVIRVSLRSLRDFPCNRMAAEFFNGGGHLNAAGGELRCSMEEAIRAVESAVEAYKYLLA